jgi:hypothetical protein
MQGTFVIRKIPTLYCIWITGESRHIRPQVRLSDTGIRGAEQLINMGLHWNVWLLGVYPEDGDSIKTLLSTCITESHRRKVALLLRIWKLLGSESRKGTGCPNCRFRRVCEFAKSDYYLRHVCMSVCLSARPSVRIEWLGSHWTNFHEIWYLSTFGKNLWRKFKFRENLTVITGTLHEVQYTFMIHLWSYLSQFF